MQKHEDLFALPERIPNFFIVGGPKCGTTSLFEWLRRHPDTYLPVKEPNFLSRDVFDARDVPGAVTDWGAYLNRLMPIEHADKITGESTPRYLYSDIALELLGCNLCGFTRRSNASTADCGFGGIRGCLVVLCRFT